MSKDHISLPFFELHESRDPGPGIDVRDRPRVMNRKAFGYTSFPDLNDLKSDDLPSADTPNIQNDSVEDDVRQISCQRTLKGLEATRPDIRLRSGVYPNDKRASDQEIPHKLYYRITSWLAQVVGAIMITVELAAMLTEPALECFGARGRLGKEGITLDDIREGLAEMRWNATTNFGLLAGISLDQRVASPTRAFGGWVQRVGGFFVAA